MKKVLLLSTFLCVFSIYSQGKSRELKSSREITENKFNVLENVNGYAENVSSNGQYVVGTSGLGFLWDLNDGTIVPLEPIVADTNTEALDVNSSGTVAGFFKDPETIINITDNEGNVVRTEPATMAGIWKEGVWQSLGLGTFRPEDLNKDYHGSTASCISEDGKVVGGWVWASRLAPIVWTYNENENTWNSIEYSLPENEVFDAKITCMSSDGSIVGGWIEDADGGRRAILWKSPTEPIIIGNVQIGGVDDGCNDISDNGKYVAFNSSNKAGIYDIENGTIEFTAGHLDAMAAGMTCVTNNGIGFGYSDFFHFLTGRWRIAFAYSKSLGFMDMGDFVTTFAPDMDIPADMLFDPAAKDLKVPMSVTGDGKVIVGYTGPSNVMRKPWAMMIATELIIYNKPSNLTATVTERNKVTLSWEAPETDPENELKGYRIFLDGTAIKDIEPTLLTYVDQAPNGKHNYHVAAIYENGTSPGTNTVVVSIVDTYELPLFENFESGSFEANYWTPSAETSSWTISTFFNTGLQGKGARCENWEGSYSDGLVSRHLDATNLEQIYITFALRSTGYNDPAEYKDTLKVEISDGDNWRVVKEYLGTRKETTYGIESLDLSELAKGKLFQIRFRVVGTGDSRIWDLDNIRVDNIKQTGLAADDIIGIIKGDSALLAWKNPTGAYELSYEQTPLYDNAIGNEGTPFIAAIAYDDKDLELYKGLYLSSITAYINQNVPDQELKLGLAIFEDGIKTTQDIQSFTPNTWNTFVLDQPILIDGTKSLTFGIDVITHSPQEIPIGTDSNENYIPVIDGKGNIYSEDGGLTWDKLSNYTNQYTNLPLRNNWSIAGNLTTSANPSMLPEKDENIAGYTLYRNGEKITDKLLYLPQFVDSTATELDTYVVKAYYLDEGLFSPESKEYILKTTNGIFNNSSDNELIVYPNPATEYIRIEGEYNKATLMDVSGKVISTTPSNTIIPVNNLPEGMYLLEVTTLKGKEVHKVVISK